MSPLTPHDRPGPHAAVCRHTDLGRNLVLFQPQVGQALTLIGVALDLWRALDGQRTLAEIADDLAQRYDQPAPVILADALDFINWLQRNLFITAYPQPDWPVSATPPRPRTVIPADTPASPPVNGPAYSLPLADGAHFEICARDTHAARVVDTFARAASLRETTGLQSSAVALTVPVATRSTAAPTGDGCLIDPPGVVNRPLKGVRQAARPARAARPLTGADWLWRQTLRVVAELGRHLPARGGLLLHSALAAHPTVGGVLISGASGEGKSTASRRLPPPWAALCDDAALIIRTTAGYQVQPLPTWSHLFYADETCTWATAAATPLNAICLLQQGDVDRVTPIEPADAIGFLMQRARDLLKPLNMALSARDTLILNQQLFDALRDLLRAVPCYRLEATLHGAFWLEIEKSIDHEAP